MVKGKKARATTPVSSKGYAFGETSFKRNHFTNHETGFLTLTSKLFQVFLKALLKNFPVAVLGTSLTNSTSRGYL